MIAQATARACISIAVSSLSTFLICAQALALPTIFGNVSYGSFAAGEGPYTYSLTAGPQSSTNTVPLHTVTGNEAGFFDGPDQNFNDPYIGTYQATLYYESSVQNGIIHAVADGNVSAAAGSLGSVLGANSGVGDTLYWLDTIKTTGQSATNQYTLTLHDNVQTLSASGGGDAHYSNVLEFYDLSANVGVPLFQCGTANPSDTYCSSHALAGTPSSVTFSAKQGEQYALLEQFTLSGSAQQAGTAGSSNFKINLADTAYFNIDPQTPGASYTTGSGINYASSVFPPVPEPSSSILFGAGAFLMLVVMARRRLQVGQRFSSRPEAG
jgi:hypothetical protein